MYADVVAEITALRRQCCILDVCMAKTGKPNPIYGGAEYSNDFKKWWAK
jgi:hypothetical protein